MNTKESTDKPFNPELGQAMFGQPTQELDCPWYIKTALNCLSYYWDIGFRRLSNPFDNTGWNYNGEYFQVEAYSWDDETDQEWNFKCDEMKIQVSWYKHLNRGTSINRIPSEAETLIMLDKCLKELQQYKGTRK